MSVLPDELWGIVVENGIGTKTLNFKDLCCLSITCRRLRRLSDDDSIWLPILLSDFPSSPSDFTLNGNRSDTTINGVRNKAAAASAHGRCKNHYKIRHAYTALNVWQPEVIRGRQKQIIQQCNVPVDFRINSLQMEISVCKHRIDGFEKALSITKTRLHEAKEKLASVKYHPLQGVEIVSFLPNELRVKPKKFKHS